MIKEIAETISGVISPITKMIDNISTTKEEKLQLKNALVGLQNNLLEIIINAKKEVMLAELQQDDLYTKRARPTVIYAGLAILFVNYVLLPWIVYFSHGAMNIPKIVMPDAFWYAWGGVAGVYSFQRTREKIARGGK